MKKRTLRHWLLDGCLHLIPRKGKRLIVIAVSFVFILRTIIKQRTICYEHLKKVSSCLQLSVLPDVLVFPCIVADALIRWYGIDREMSIAIDPTTLQYDPEKQEMIAKFIVDHLPDVLYYTDKDRIQHDIILLLRNLDTIFYQGDVCHVVMEL